MSAFLESREKMENQNQLFSLRKSLPVAYFQIENNTTMQNNYEIISTELYKNTVEKTSSAYSYLYAYGFEPCDA